MLHAEEATRPRERRSPSTSGPPIVARAGSVVARTSVRANPVRLRRRERGRRDGTATARDLGTPVGREIERSREPSSGTLPSQDAAAAAPTASSSLARLHDRTNLGAHLPRGLEPIGGLLRQRPEADRLEPGVHLRVDLRRRPRLVDDVAEEGRDRCLGREREAPGEQLEEDDADGVEVASARQSRSPFRACSGDM